MLAAACLALNQRGEGSSPSGPTTPRLRVSACFWMWERGSIHRLREPGDAGSNPAIQTRKRKGKPTVGDGSRLENGRAETCLEGSTPSPSARCNVPLADRPRHRSSKPARRVRFPQGTWRVHGSVGNRSTTLAQNEGCCGFDSHLGHWKKADECPGGASPEWPLGSQPRDRGFKSHPGCCVRSRSGRGARP